MAPGDVVRLKCGGPLMVIARADEPEPPYLDEPPPPFRPGRICLWQTKAGVLREAAFPREVLELESEALAPPASAVGPAKPVQRLT